MAYTIPQKVDILIGKIHDRASRQNRSHVYYLYGSVLPTRKVGTATDFAELHHCLAESKQHYPYAVALTGYILENSGSPLLASEISEASMSEAHTFTEVKLPELALREVLANIASELNDQQATQLVNLIARHDLKIDPKQITGSGELFRQMFHCQEGIESGSFEAVVLAFTKLQEMDLLLAEHGGISHIAKRLEAVRRMDLVAKHLESFVPTKGYRLAVNTDAGIPPDLKISMPSDPWKEYQCLLQKAYAQMPEIPHNQWPPVRKAQYVSLALILNEDMIRTDLYSRATIHGSVDDIIRKKQDVSFEDVFPQQLTLNHPRATLIEGRPGCGKTTLIVKVSKDWGNGSILNECELFILVELRRFMGKANITLEDMVSIHCPQPHVVNAIVHRIENEGGRGVVFAFDGLDEYPHALQAKNLIFQIIRGTKAPKSYVYMTSRPAGSAKFRPHATKNVEIIGFLREQIHKYIYAHYENKSYKAKSLTQFLDSHPNVSRMCYLPLHLAMIVYLHESGESMPDRETEMYLTFTLHTLLRALRKEKLNDLDPEAEEDLEFHEIDDLPQDKEKIFREICLLALKATEKQKQVFTGKEILHNKVLPVVPTRKEFDSLGMLTVDRQVAERALPTKTFSFLHLTLQEFLAAYYLYKCMSDEEQLEEIDQFKEMTHMRVVWKFYCGLSHGGEIFLDAFTSIVEGNKNDRQGVLHMMHCAYESTEAGACSSLMKKLHGVMDVQDVTLNAADCIALGFIAAKAPSGVGELDMSYCHIGPEGMEAFVNEIKTVDTLPNVHTLRLRARIDLKPIGREGAPALLQLLKKLPNLGELRLYGNEIHPEKCQMLVPYIQKMTTLHTLILSRNSLDRTTGKQVSSILENIPLLQEFYISYNPLEDAGLRGMLHGLLNCTKLKILGLRGTGLTKESGTTLSEILEKLILLEWLLLYQNNLGDDGVIDMLPGLYAAQSLQELSLVNNHITDRGAVSLAGYFRSTTTLLRARMYYNDISEKGKIAIRRSVLDRPSTMVSLQCAL